jgi:hypothetical protein
MFENVVIDAGTMVVLILWTALIMIVLAGAWWARYSRK